MKYEIGDEILLKENVNNITSKIIKLDIENKIAIESED